jgi:hypothetical protein
LNPEGNLNAVNVLQNIASLQLTSLPELQRWGNMTSESITPRRKKKNIVVMQSMLKRKEKNIAG